MATAIAGCQKQNQPDFRYQDVPKITKVKYKQNYIERELRCWQDHPTFNTYLMLIFRLQLCSWYI